MMIAKLRQLVEGLVGTEMSLDRDSGIYQELHGSVNGGKAHATDPAVDPLLKLLQCEVAIRLQEHLYNHIPLTGVLLALRIHV